MNSRSKRKLEHIRYALEVTPGPKTTGFEDIHLIHQALSPLDIQLIQSESYFLGKKLKFPLLINAITGGAPGLEKLNKKLALTAKECGIALALGSQTAAIEDPSLTSTYKIAREMNPEGVILANVSASVNYEMALEAVEMVKADGLQLHLNIAQELVMSEGDRNFGHLLEKIALIKEKTNVPVIIKEVGFGLSMETVDKLNNLGIKHYDIGGAGGTNFVAIENARKATIENKDLIDWGIPTAITLIETLNCLNKCVTICASGGIYTPADILKSLILGANLVGIAAPFLKLAYNQDECSIIEYTNNLIKRVKTLMLLIGASNLEELKNKPVVITGMTREWLEVRGINIKKYAMRGMKEKFATD
ncbi:MAG: type 2 isopentenyl-diphosphate Delta-isomerase [Peptococcales bacterium]|jgi:isopentenyl-diphosphate delta-isomerase